MASTPLPDLHARKAAVLARVGLAATIGRTVKLIKRGREWQGLCPFHSERSPSFTVVEDKDFAHCFGCGWHGGLFDFVMARDGVDFAEALRRLEGEAGSAPATAPAPSVRASRRTEPESTTIDGRAAAATVWREAGPARGSIVEAWFSARGIDPRASGVLDVVRFHPRCPAGLWRRGAGTESVRVHAPAMIAPMVRVQGEPGARVLGIVGVHVTLLSADGYAKADLPEWRDRMTGKLHQRATRVMWGAGKGGAVIVPAIPMPTGAVLSDWLAAEIDREGGEVVVGEGLESTLSLLARVPDARIGCATLSLGNLEGVARTMGKAGALPLWMPVPDFGRGLPFSFEQPGRVLIGVDADMKPLRARWVQERRGSRPVQRDVTGAERAALCGALAAAHWRNARAEAVRVSRPPMGCDFNDLDRPLEARSAA